MKNLSLLLNATSLVLISVLFFLHFSSKNKTADSPGSAGHNPGQISGFKIAYFDMDTLQANFEYFKEVEKELGASNQKKRTELENKRNAYLNKVKEYQAKGQRMTQAELGQAQQDIAQSEKEYQMEEQSKSKEIQDESFTKLQDVKKKIEDFLKSYNKDKNYSMILASSPELIYYKDTAYNITNDLIKGLNKQYPKK